MIDTGEVEDRGHIDTVTWEINITGNIYPAEVALRSVYDPGNKEIKCWGDKEGKLGCGFVGG